MSVWKKCLIVLVLAGVSAPLAAQTVAEEERAESMRQVEVEMREAERRFEEAAQRVAELSASELARAGNYTQWVTQGDRPMIGITISSIDEEGPVEGVAVAGITPGGAADEAGLRAGDTITAVNSESLSSENEVEANKKLLDFMQGVEEGDVLDIEYLRNGKAASVELEPRLAASSLFEFSFGGPPSATSPAAPHVYAFRWAERHGGHGFGEMEMVELNEDLGRYFGTDSGLLIVKAPEDNAFKLRDGDVIKSIDGREPKDHLHAVRILGSYEVG